MVALCILKRLFSDFSIDILPIAKARGFMVHFGKTTINLLTVLLGYYHFFRYIIKEITKMNRMVAAVYVYRIFFWRLGSLCKALIGTPPLVL